MRECAACVEATVGDAGDLGPRVQGFWKETEAGAKDQAANPEAGRVFELSVGSETFRLRKGDSFFFRSDLPHSYRNIGKQVAKVLWINSPPTF